MDSINNEEVLQIFASDHDLSFVDDSNLRADKSSNVLLKFYTKGSQKLPGYAELVEFLTDEVKLSICGISFKSKAVLFEISYSNHLENWLVKLFEERSSNIKLTADGQQNILNICKGKFSMLINHRLVFLVMIPNSTAITFPCQEHTEPYGFSNGDIINLSAFSLKEEPSAILINFLKYFSDLNYMEVSLIYGIRLEWNEDSDTHNLRFLIKRSNLCERLLKTLKDAFKSISFLSETFHIIPIILKTRIDTKLANGHEFSDVLNLVISNDLIRSDVNEMTIITRNNTRPALSIPPHHSTSTHVPSTSFNCKSASNRSIFDRLKPKDYIPSHTDRMNNSMGFRRVHRNYDKTNHLNKIKIKSVVKKVTK